MIGEHSLPWPPPLLNGVERAYPIILSPSKDETRATEYSKAATRRNWGEVWDNFDRRANAKAANDGGVAAEAAAAEAEATAAGDMFSRAGVGAE